jgi:hypothetical protein
MQRIFFALTFILALNLIGDNIAYKSFKGARRINPDNGAWEVGWLPPARKEPDSWIYPVKGLEGVVFKDFAKKECKGNTIITPKEMGIEKAELPLLGIKGDYYIIISRNLNCPVRVYSDTDKIAIEEWIGGVYPACYVGNRIKQQKWFESKEKIKDRQKILSYATSAVKPIPITTDSRWLDPQRTGNWHADPMMKIRNYMAPMNLGYIMLLPATTFEVPFKKEWAKGAKISFDYIKNGKDTKASFLLDPAYMPQKGNLKIGFTGARQRAKGVYVVQNPGKGKEGMIVGKMATGKHEYSLAIKPGSIKIEAAKWKPYDRVNVDKRRHIGYEGTPEHNEFEAFDTRYSRDWGYLMSYIKTGNKFAGRAYPKRNAFTRIIEDMSERQKKDALRMAHKYGMRIAFDINEDLTPGSYIPEKYKAEILNADSGKFIKTDYLDWANPEAVAWEAENIKNRVKAYKGLPTYLMIHEGIGDRQSGNVSKAALESFRKFSGNPNAKFPVPPTFPETERTTNKPDEELIKKYIEWKLGYYRGNIFMKNIFEAASKALKGGNYKGGCYFGAVSDGGAYFVPYIAESEDVALLCPENVRSSSQGIFQVWRKAAQKYPERLKLMPHSYPMLVTADTDTFIKWFEDVGLLPEVKGLILGGGGLAPKALFEALAAKYYGKSRLSVEEADAIIKTLKEKGIFYLDGYDKKHIKKRSTRNRSGKNIFDMKHARKKTIARNKIKVDGNFQEWQRTQWTDVKGKEQLLGKKDWKGNNDLSYSFASAYDDDNLYLAVKVNDDKRALRTQTLNAEGDEVQIFVGFVNDPNSQNISIGYNGFSLRMVPDKRFPQVYGGQSFLEPVSGSKSISRQLENGYEIEASIPWKNFKYKPQKGKLLPIEFHVLDADHPAGEVEKTMLWNAFEGKKKPWSVKGTTQWGLLEFK